MVALRARLLGGMLIACLLTLYTLQVAEVVGVGTAAGVAPRHPGVLLVLGKQLDQGQVDADFRARLMRASSVVGRQAGWRVIISGGGKDSEAQTGASWIAAQGMVAGVELEELARNTRENLDNTRQLLAHDGTMAVISSRYHLARVARLARQQQMAVDLVAAEDRMQWSGDQVLLVAREAAYLSGLALLGQ